MPAFSASLKMVLAHDCRAEPSCAVLQLKAKTKFWRQDMRETLRGLGQLPGLACPRFADVRQHFVFFARLNAMSRKHLLVIGLAFSLPLIGCHRCRPIPNPPREHRP